MQDINWPYIFWGGLGAIIYIWPDLGPLRKFKIVTAAELEKISTNYSKIASKFLTWGLSRTLIIAFILLGSTQFIHLLNKDLLPALLGGLLPMVGLTKSLFAIQTGLYPNSKFFGQNTSFYYSENDEVKDIARNHIISIIAANGLIAIYILSVIIISP